MSMNDVKQIFQNKFKNLGGKLKLDKNEDHSNMVPSYTDGLYQSAKVTRDMCNDLYKKMANVCVINYNVLDEKKTKKNSWETLSAAISESEKKLTEEGVTKDILITSVKAFDDLSVNTRDFERSISTNVIRYFQDISEDTNLTSIKKTMTSLSKDMKANSEKVLNLQEQINNQNEMMFNRKSMDVSNVGSAESKLITAQQAEENSEKELDLKKDLFFSKLFAFEAEKIIMAEKMLEFFKQYLEYHIECKNIITKYIPELQMIIDERKKNYVFHLPLEEHVASTNRKLSYVLETCIQELDNEETLQEEGLFRISGSKSKLELLKNALNVMRADEHILKNCDSAVFAGVLKQYLRELPIPLMTFALYDKWCEAGNKIKQGDTERVKALIKECLSQMPTCYYDNLVYLMQFLKKIAENEAVNKMNSSNLALMLGPNLIRNRSINDNDDSDASRVMMLSSPGSGVLDFMITHFYELFPDVPVYTASKSKEPMHHIKIPEKEIDKKNLKSPKPFTDNDSLSSGEMLSDDTSVSSFDASAKSKEINSKLKIPRKPPAPPPPPPPTSKIVIPEIEYPPEELKVREPRDGPDFRPTVKKRTSVMEKSQVIEKSNSETADLQIKRAPSTFINSKSVTPPSIPVKRPPFLPSAEVVDSSRKKIESQPPRRPNNPPPPIPSFDKLKETLEQKSSESPTSKVEGRKPSASNEDSKSGEMEYKQNVCAPRSQNSELNDQSTSF